MSHPVTPSITQQTQPFPSEFEESLFVRFHPLFILPRTRKKFVGTTGESLYPVGGTGWYMDLVTNHPNPTSIGQKHSHCLANCSKSIVIGYSGRKLLWKLLTIIYKGKPLPRSPFVCSCWVLIRVHRWLAPEEDKILIYKPWFKAIQFVRRRTVLSTILPWFSRKSAHIQIRTSSSSWRMCGNQASYLTSQCHRNVRILTVLLCGAGWKDFPG